MPQFLHLSAATNSKPWRPRYKTKTPRMNVQGSWEKVQDPGGHRLDTDAASFCWLAQGLTPPLFLPLQIGLGLRKGSTWTVGGLLGLAS